MIDVRMHVFFRVHRRRYGRTWALGVHNDTDAEPGEVGYSGDHVGRLDNDGLRLNTDDRIRPFIL